MSNATNGFGRRIGGSSPWVPAHAEIQVTPEEDEAFSRLPSIIVPQRDVKCTWCLIEVKDCEITWCPACGSSKLEDVNNEGTFEGQLAGGVKS